MWSDETGRFALDSLLRKHGFRIHKRPCNGVALWCREGKLYTRRQALKQCPASEVEDAKLEEEIYLDQRFEV